MKKDVFELTNPQKSIWYIEQFYKGTSVNSICGTVIFDEFHYLSIIFSSF